MWEDGTMQCMAVYNVDSVLYNYNVHINKCICLFKVKLLMNKSFHIIYIPSKFLEQSGHISYFLLKMNSSTPKTPNLPYWASKSAKKRLKKNC